MITSVSFVAVVMFILWAQSGSEPSELQIPDALSLLLPSHILCTHVYNADCIGNTRLCSQSHTVLSLKPYLQALQEKMCICKGKCLKDLCLDWNRENTVWANTISFVTMGNYSFLKIPLFSAIQVTSYIIVSLHMTLRKQQR